ncbi:MAG TPA: alpha/beta hydrolase-fold protein [Amycolatopsis sp.]|uniref:alpha/beta hydrolase n=1 Tax=Amycolatopsis sp. TaxID=37632 RepID=UPI002B49B1F8|nr:alpha/beta hydrolase-fold protein [Amycolatopsis sp.]HKS45635.1 alpha/beta hydrolase-fold protein [Amycolatopsis sp.]
MNRTTDLTIPDDVARHVRELGPLESPLIWGTFTAATVALVAVMVWSRHRKVARRRAGMAALCCFLLAAVTAVNGYVGYVRTPNDLGRLMQRTNGPLNALGRLLDDGENAPDGSAPQRTPYGERELKPGPPGMRIEQVDITDPAHGVPSGKSYVILPPGYGDPANTAQRYPVVYLIHGYPYGGPQDWLTAGDAPSTIQMLLADHAISPMIVVSVDLTAGRPSKDWECLDVPGGPQLETYLTRAVVPEIDQRYRTVADRDGRALGGMSGGGYGALNIGLHHVDEFGGLLISLPYDTLGEDADLLGGDRQLIEANTPRDYLPTMTFSDPVAVILAVGTGAPTDVATAKRIASAFESRGQEAVVHSEPGFNHTWHTARATLPYLLVFADQHFRAASNHLVAATNH